VCDLKVTLSLSDSKRERGRDGRKELHLETLVGLAVKAEVQALWSSFYSMIALE